MEQGQDDAGLQGGVHHLLLQRPGVHAQQRPALQQQLHVPGAPPRQGGRGGLGQQAREVRGRGVPPLVQQVQQVEQQRGLDACPATAAFELGGDPVAQRV